MEAVARRGFAEPCSQRSAVGALIAAALVLGVVLMRPPELASAATVPKEFGVVSDPWSVDEWAVTIGASPTMPMQYESWSRGRTLDAHFAEARRQGLTSYVVTWEPWAPVPASAGRAAQRAPQPEYANAAIAAGAHDEYVRGFARSVRDSGLRTVYLRYAHEMNGDWYPWSHDPAGYIAAWRHVVELFRAEGATNARFVYSFNPNLFQDDATWRSGFWRYWPGGAYVDLVGATMINFGSAPCAATPCPPDAKGYSVALFSTRVIQGYRLTGKSTLIEVNSSLEGADVWFRDLTAWLSTGTTWISGVVLSQAPSRGAQQMSTGNLDWNVLDRPELQPVICSLVQETTGRPPCP
jgi:hypothetical protein